MNQFTKEELMKLECFVFDGQKNEEDLMLYFKIKYLIGNYCEHEEWEMIEGDCERIG